MAGRLRRRADGPAGGVTRRAPAPSGAPRHFPAARLAAVTVILVAWGACLALNWPGHFTWDSVMQLAEGRRGLYTGQHPPVMSWLLGLADAVRPGAAIFVIVQASMVFGGLLAFATLGRGSWLAALLAAAFAALPQLMLYPSIVWKDVLFAGAACGGFASLAWAGVTWAKPSRRWALLAVAVVLLALATLARQNGAVVLPFAAGAVWWFATQNGARRPPVVGAGFAARAGRHCSRRLGSAGEPGDRIGRRRRAVGASADLRSRRRCGPRSGVPVRGAPGPGAATGGAAARRRRPGLFAKPHRHARRPDLHRDRRAAGPRPAARRPVAGADRRPPDALPAPARGGVPLGAADPRRRRSA